MANPLLERVQPAELAERGQVIEFKGCVGDFERLTGIAEADFAALGEQTRPRGWRSAPVSARLEFAWLDVRKAFPAVTGRIRAEMPAICQRCLEPFRMPVETALSVLFVGEDADGGVTEMPDFETWALQGDLVNLQDVVEESIVMALPLAPLHEAADKCGPLAGEIPAGETDTARPFADLRSQMEKANK